MKKLIMLTLVTLLLVSSVYATRGLTTPQNAIPESYEDTVNLIRSSDQEVQNYVMWTYNQKTIIKGMYNEEYWIGTSNKGLELYGIINNGAFACMYDGHLWYGKYNNKWQWGAIFPDTGAKVWGYYWTY